MQTLVTEVLLKQCADDRNRPRVKLSEGRVTLSMNRRLEKQTINARKRLSVMQQRVAGASLVMSNFASEPRGTY
jgi:hypothetical protein